MEAKRKLILAAAAGIIEQHGSQFTIEHVAQAAGVAKGTVYLYFDSKTALVEQVLVSAVEEMQQVLEKANRGNSCSARLSSMIAAHFKHINARSPLIHKLVATEPELLGNLKQEFLPRVLAIHQTYSALLSQGIKSGEFRPHDTKIIAASLLAMIHNLAVSTSIFNHQAQPRQILAEVLSMLGKGITETSYAFKNLLEHEEDVKQCKV
ncbi:MAG: TetR/AcrR family transcriptional regulator [Firmicutes bacterium]|nr:TetR/AcrR family transcriptional regulator [Bacillota bacterium]